ncbi:MAG: TraB/GumN family protein, partial [Proteobacteria bacterium]|nr:TraB/GumN family protein [Pseudomonadota bacterium]
MLITILYANNILADCHSCDAFIISSENESAEINIQDVLYKQGLLWKITTPEGKINYLFGTMHSQDYAVTKYPPQVRLALVKSKTLLMESIPNETSNKIFLEHMYFTDGAQLNALLEEEFYKRLTVIAADYGIPVEKINHLKPWAAFSIIGRPKPVRAPTLESNLYHFAQR